MEDYLQLLISKMENFAQFESVFFEWLESQYKGVLPKFKV